MDTRTRYEVTPNGYQQIERWMREHYREATLARMTPDEIVNAVYAWAERAEDTAQGELELPAHLTRSGRIEYLVPERITVVEADV